MKQTIFTVVFFYSFILHGIAQDRYLYEITDSVTIDTYTYAQKDNKELELDIYTPAFDSEISRPVLIYMHGGGFSGGIRDNNNAKEFCKMIAKYGYVAVSIDYRLTRKGTKTLFGCDCPSYEKIKTFSAAVEDLQDATYFIIQQRELLGINPQKIILSGSSAGAETVLNAAYEPPYCYGLESGPVAYAGVIAMAGAIPNLIQIYDESAIPSMFFHGTCDSMVPYGTAPHHYCPEGSVGYLMLNGSYAIAEKLRKLGKPYWLHTTCGGGHELASAPMKKYFEEIIEFCYQFVLNNSKDQIHTIVQGDHNCTFPGYNFCNE